MKTNFKKQFFLSLLMATLGALVTSQLAAQTYTNVYLFTEAGGDGAFPECNLIVCGDTLYGTTVNGGAADSGMVFRVNLDGSDYTNLYSFTALPYPDALLTNSDGGSPTAGLVLLSNTLYGTAYNGGPSGYGTIFRVNTDGSNFTNLYSFTNGSDGANPESTLVLAGGILYGTAPNGGNPGAGTLFAIHPDGSGFTNVYTFNPTDTDNGTNSDGSFPAAGLIFSGGTLYGVTSDGGNWNSGTIFSVNTNGRNFTNLYNFSAADPISGTNKDGANPMAALTLVGDILFGTANDGGPSANGTIFAVNTNGTGFTNLYSFTADSNYGPNGDGANPQANLLLVGETLYGTAAYAGTAAGGTLFGINLDGTGFTNLYNFNGYVNNVGQYPLAGLIWVTNAFYGTTYEGGNQYGTVFSLSATLPVVVPPLLSIMRAGTNVILSWTNAVGYNLQSVTNLASPAWVDVPGQSPVTNPITGSEKFYQLAQ
jgi:uncharacterized repeat protein (TIGR03803 family)